MTEFIGPSVEVVRGQGNKPDVVFSNTAVRQDLVTDLRGLLVGGIPSTWRPTESTTAPHRMYVHYLDDPNNPEYYAKVRSGTSRYKYIPGGAKLRRIFNADLSLINEMSLAPRVKEVIGSAGVQQSAYDHGGFERVEYIEPLAGVIEKRYGPRKIMVYEYKEMVEPTPQELFRLAYFIDQLRIQFDAAGINPMDLLSRQLMISANGEANKRTLYLLDSERYVTK